MNKIITMLILIILTITIVSAYYRNEYIRIRSEVIRATGYDISYPKEWKGVCK
jgi:hypothetical protein